MTDTKTRRTRRGRGTATQASQHPCAREGCPKPASVGYEHCCFICAGIAQELVRVQRLCQAFPGVAEFSELWTQTVAVSDGWTRCLDLEHKLFKASRSVGVTAERWHAIKQGTP